MRRALLLALVVAAVPALGQRGGQSEVVLTAKRALLFADPLLVVGQRVLGVTASPDGRYLVATRHTPDPAPPTLTAPERPPLRKDLVVWDSASGSTREVPLPPGMSEAPLVQWFPGSNRALVRFMVVRALTGDAPAQLSGGPVRTTQETYFLDAATAKMQRAGVPEGAYVLSVQFSPRLPLAVVVSDALVNAQDGPTEAYTLQTVRSDGTVDKPVQLGQMYSHPQRTSWTPDGRQLLVEVDRPGDGRLPVKVVLHFDPLSGGLTESIGAIESYEEPARESDVRLEPKATDIGTNGAPGRAVSWWVRSTTDTERPAALVTEHAESALLPAGEKYVAFVSNGALFVRWTLQLDVQQYRSMLLAAQRAVLVSNAKQIALAAIMYSADHDDVIPSGLSRGDLMPYLNNEGIFKDGWTYTFGGGNITGVKDPANTELGYISGPGGRAVAYLDGHVKWVPN